MLEQCALVVVCGRRVAEMRLHLGREVSEEREPHPEPRVLRLVLLRRLLQQFEEEPLALGRDRVDRLATGARARLACDRTLALEPAERRVQGSVRDAPEPADLLG